MNICKGTVSWYRTQLFISATRRPTGGASMAGTTHPLPHASSGNGSFSPHGGRSLFKHASACSRQPDSAVSATGTGKPPTAWLKASMGTDPASGMPCYNAPCWGTTTTDPADGVNTAETTTWRNNSWLSLTRYILGSHLNSIHMYSHCDTRFSQADFDTIII